MKHYHVLIKFLIIMALFSVSICQAEISNIETRCDFETKSTPIGKGTIEYKATGNGPVILLLHGLFAQKEQWDALACELAGSGYRVISPDLPGYGKSLNFSLPDYRLESQVVLMHEFAKNLDLKKFNIAGSSMGGAIAALYSKKYHPQIFSLAFIGSPLGVIDWSPRVKESIYNGVNPFIPINADQLDLEMKLLFYKPPIIPEDSKSGLVNAYMTSNRHYQQVWDIVNLYMRVIEDGTASQTPTLILWGREDGIFNIAGISGLQKKFSNHQAWRIADASHLLMLEKPKEVGSIYLGFLKSKGLNGLRH